MKKSITYKTAVKTIARRMDVFKNGAFGSSLIIAEMFDVSKQKALDDIIEERR